LMVIPIGTTLGGAMARQHGRSGYKGGCRCDVCRSGQASYQARYRDRVVNGETRPLSSAPVAPELPPAGPGPVEQATEVELASLPAAQERLALAAGALAMARVLDHPRAHSSKPAAAKVLVMVLDELRKGSARGRRGSLSAVRAMTEASVPRSQ
jgi:hypothetical protein